MRAHLLSVLVGGLLVLGGWLLGGHGRSADADVALDANSSFLATSSAELPGTVVLWHRDGSAVVRATRYTLYTGGRILVEEFSTEVETPGPSAPSGR